MSTWKMYNESKPLFSRIDEEHKEKNAEQMFNDLDYKKRIKDGCIKFERHTENVDEALIEFDLLNTFDRCKECCVLNEIEALKKMSEKGYFNGIDPFTKVHDIIDNCEVIN